MVRHRGDRSDSDCLFACELVYCYAFERGEQRSDGGAAQRAPAVPLLIRIVPWGPLLLAEPQS
eukprot:3999867-Pyramimonas_sp.AAC.1